MTHGCKNFFGIVICRVNALSASFDHARPLDPFQSTLRNSITENCPSCNQFADRVLKAYNEYETQLQALNVAKNPLHRSIIQKRIETTFQPKVTQLYTIYQTTKCSKTNPIQLPKL